MHINWKWNLSQNILTYFVDTFEMKFFIKIGKKYHPQLSDFLLLDEDYLLFLVYFLNWSWNNRSMDCKHSRNHSRGQQWTFTLEHFHFTILNPSKQL